MKKALLLLALGLTGCSPNYVLFTETIRQDLENRHQDFSKVQFGIKETISLRRATIQDKQIVIDGQIKKQSDFVRDKITFTKSGDEVLEGICKDRKEKALAMYFEEGDLVAKRLVFLLNNEGNYVFYRQAKDAKYDGQIYDIVEGNNAKLYINRVELKTFKETTRKVSGLKVN